MTVELQMRCPVGNRLFGKLIGEQVRVDRDMNLMEFDCRDCRRSAHSGYDSDQVKRILHRYDFVGDLVETEVVFESGRSVVQVTRPV